MGKIRCYRAYELEHIRLATFADICSELFREKGSFYRLYTKDIYFDMGQDWWYSALITMDMTDEDDQWQSLCPRDWELIIDCDSINELVRLANVYVDTVMNGDVCVRLYESQPQPSEYSNKLIKSFMGEK